MKNRDEHWNLAQYQIHLRGEDPDNPPAKGKKPKTHWEQKDAIALVKWFDLQYPQYQRVFFHIANEACAPIGPKVGGILKAMGVRSGSSDYFLAVARNGFHGLFIELKATPPNDAPITENQAACLQAYRDQGYRSELCQGWESAMELIQSYLNG